MAIKYIYIYIYIFGGITILPYFEEMCHGNTMVFFKVSWYFFFKLISWYYCVSS